MLGHAADLGQTVHDRLFDDLRHVVGPKRRKPFGDRTRRAVEQLVIQQRKQQRAHVRVRQHQRPQGIAQGRIAARDDHQTREFLAVFRVLAAAGERGQAQVRHLRVVVQFPVHPGQQDGGARLAVLQKQPPSGGRQQAELAVTGVVGTEDAGGFRQGAQRDGAVRVLL